MKWKILCFLDLQANVSFTSGELDVMHAVAGANVR